MSEVSRGSNSGGGAFAKVVQKTLARTRTKVLQRVGKAEKTTDDVYKDNIAAFQRQQTAAIRLQKEMKHYLSCVKAMTVAAKGLYAVMKETYEEDWYDPHSFNSSLNSLELLHVSYEAELAERVGADITEYTEQFPIYKEKMNKRNRKRLDYDNAKHAYDTVYAAKKADSAKISKAHESLLDTKALFEEINNELHRELPKFHDYRVEFLSTNFLRLCTAESTFHTNVGKVHDDLAKVLETLAKSHAEEMDKLSKTPQSVNTSLVQQGAGDGLDLSSLSADTQSASNSNGHGGDSHARTPNKDRLQKVNVEETEQHVRSPPARPPTTPLSPASSNAGNPFATSEDVDSEQTDNMTQRDDVEQKGDEEEQEHNRELKYISDQKDDLELKDSSEQKDELEPKEDSREENSLEQKGGSEEKDNMAETGSSDLASSDVPGNPFEDESEEAYNETSDADKPAADQVGEAGCEATVNTDSSIRSAGSSKGSVSDPSTPTVLYQVIATHPYEAEDTDELSFDAGDRVNVIEFDGEDEQDEGWLMGINVNTAAKGVFPANFTQEIERDT